MTSAQLKKLFALSGRLDCIAANQGLLLPYLSEADPDVSAEGSIDPLGIAQLGDLLADTIAPGISARMTRPRLMTAMAVAAAIAEQQSDRVAADGVTPAWLVVEWHFIEALVSTKGLPDSARRGVGGTAKAGSVLALKAHLDAGSYLKAAKVFGFHGVFKRLAVNLEILDDGLCLTERGRELLTTWEREQDLPGFVAASPGTEGGSLRRTFDVALSRALETGSAQPINRSVAQRLAEAIRPDDAGPGEKALLWRLLTDPMQPLRREVLGAIDQQDYEGWTEWDVLGAMHAGASRDLIERLDAIFAYERMSCTLTRAFDACRVLGRQYGLGGAKIAQAAVLPEVVYAADHVADQYAAALRKLEDLGHASSVDLASRMDLTIGGFAANTRPNDFVEDLFAHHARVQAAKPPTGKRPWFEETPHGFFVRPAYALDEQQFQPDWFVHPMRVIAMRTFCRDLRR